MNIKNQLINLKKMLQGKKTTTGENDIYENIGDVYPFTILNNSQFRNFVSCLAKDNTLSKDMNDAFNSLWNLACIDIDGFGNNIWNLKEGQFTFFNQNGSSVSYEKVSSKGIDESFEEGRGTFVFKSSEANMVIKQHEYNKGIFLVYLSSNISEKFYEAVKNAEASSLEIIRRKQNISDFNSEVSNIEEGKHQDNAKKM